MKGTVFIFVGLVILSFIIDCGGQSATATLEPMNTPRPSATPTPTATQRPADTLTPTETPTAPAAVTFTPTPTHTATPTETPEPTDTPTVTPTRTPRPTATPRKELTAADVGLPIGTEVGHFIYKHCYVNTATHFHAGDGIYYEIGSSPSEYVVYAPVDGTVREIWNIGGITGWEIRVETPFVSEGKGVWYDIGHHDGPVDGVEVGTFVRKGEPLARLFTARDHGRIEKLVDIGIRNGPRGPNPYVEPFHPESYLNFYHFVEDDLASRSVTYEYCKGNPLP